MQGNDEEFIAYRPDKYTHVDGDNAKVEDEDEFAYEKAFPYLKWNQFINNQNSLAVSDISFKRIKRDDEEEGEVPPPADPPPGGEGEGGEGGDGGGKGKDDSGEIKLYLTPVIGLTVFFALMFIIGPVFVRKGPNRGIFQCSIMLAAFCMWIFWVTIYIGQMNPLMGPRLENTTIAWMSVKLGNPVKPPATIPAVIGE